MAKISLSPLVVDIRNKIGDTVFSKWKGINYARSRVDPSNPNTTAQQEVRDALRQLVALWKGTLGVIEDAWNDYVEGSDRSGFNAFVGDNHTAQRAGTDLQIGKSFGEDALTALTAATGAGSKEIDLTYAPTPVGAGKKYIVVAREVSGGVETGTPEVFAIDAAAASPQTITVSKAGTEYNCYVMQADDTLALATTLSTSIADSATSGA